jgi:hypothetical protein
MQSRVIFWQQQRQQQLQQQLTQPMLSWQPHCSCAKEALPLPLLLLLLLVLQEPTQQQHPGETAHSSSSSNRSRRSGGVRRLVLLCMQQQQQQQQASAAGQLLIQTRRTLAMIASGRQTAATLHQMAQTAQMGRMLQQCMALVLGRVHWQACLVAC